MLSTPTTSNPTQSNHGTVPNSSRHKKKSISSYKSEATVPNSTSLTMRHPRTLKPSSQRTMQNSSTHLQRCTAPTQPKEQFVHGKITSLQSEQEHQTPTVYPIGAKISNKLISHSTCYAHAQQIHYFRLRKPWKACSPLTEPRWHPYP